MVLRFCDCELNADSRVFRVGGGEVALQPKVLDLLVHLVRHRDRVVSKDELVEQVWEGAFVTDGAVQRAVSLLRSALGDGDAKEAIRTYPRQGYRFCAEVVEDEGGPRDGGKTPVSDDVAAARAAVGAEDWGRAVELYREADSRGGLSGADLEHWGEAAESLGRLSEAVLPFERAVAAHSAGGSPCDAARAALRLANVQLELQQTAVASGWLQRARRYLDGREPCHEVALLTWLEARFALFSGRLEEARSHAEAAHELACRLRDRDVESLGLLYRGLTSLALGEVHPGVELIDESAAAALAEQIRPWTGGIVFCGVIWGCLNRGDWRRAAGWTEQFNRWCSTNGVCGYPGLCRLHRAEILAITGRLDEAERALESAVDQLAEAMPFVLGDVYRTWGDLHLARGDLEAAEKAFLKAHELGWDPNPGFALLRAAQGNSEAALRALEGALVSGEWAVRQRRGFVLAHVAVIAARAGELERAAGALRELDGHPEIWEAPAVSAVVAQGRGELALAQGDPEAAVTHLRDSVRSWREVGAPCRMAAVRLRLAAALIQVEDVESAEIEVAAAESASRELGLGGLMSTCAETRRALADEAADATP